MMNKMVLSTDKIKDKLLYIEELESRNKFSKEEMCFILGVKESSLSSNWKRYSEKHGIVKEGRGKKTVYYTNTKVLFKSKFEFLFGFKCSRPGAMEKYVNFLLNNLEGFENCDREIAESLGEHRSAITKCRLELEKNGFLLPLKMEQKSYKIYKEIRSGDTFVWEEQKDLDEKEKRLLWNDYWNLYFKNLRRKTVEVGSYSLENNPGLTHALTINECGFRVLFRYRRDSFGITLLEIGEALRAKQLQNKAA